MHVSIAHPLCYCPGSLPLYQNLASKVAVPERDASNLFRYALFAHDPPVDQRLHFIEFVGRALWPPMLAAVGWADGPEGEASEDCIAERIDQLRGTMCRYKLSQCIIIEHTYVLRIRHL